MTTITLFTNQTTSGSSAVFRPNSLTKDQILAGIKPFFTINGTLGAGTIDLEIQNPDGSFSSTGLDDEEEIDANIPGVFEVNYSDEMLLRLTISGADGSTNISAYAKYCKDE